MEEPDHGHAHTHHRTGFRWLDISLAVSAFCVSLTTLWLTMHNARTMERLVTSNSYPNVDVVFGNQHDMHDGEGVRHVLYLALENTGIGPARLRSIELSFAGQPVRNLRELLAACCTQEPASSLPRTSYWSVWDDRGAMLPAGKSLELFAWPESDAAADPRFPRLEALRGRVGVRVCYCSVFNECYLRDRAQREPRPVKVCAEPTVAYTGN
jgi:hypothetical protein